jgi:hypothetical protein
MARQFRPVDRDQPMMLPEDMRLWMGKDHLVWFVIDVVGGLDTAGLERLGKPGPGRPGYDPQMLAVQRPASSSGATPAMSGIASTRTLESPLPKDETSRTSTE